MTFVSFFIERCLTFTINELPAKKRAGIEP